MMLGRAALLLCGAAAIAAAQSSAPASASSTPKSSAQAGKTPAAKKTTAAKVSKRKYRSSGVATVRSLPRPPKVSPATRLEANEGVQEKVSSGADIPIENAAALVPFYEQLYRHQRGETPGPLHVLQYGDSHTAADEWTGDLRDHFQQTFGDGGAGYSFAGRPWNGYRRFDVKSGSTRGWHTDGLVGRKGDGAYGLGGVSMTADRPHESIYETADGEAFELYYLQQPGGGAIQIYDNGEAVDRISTDGDLGPAYFRYDAIEGTHKLEVETLEHAPVRLFGWVAEKATGVTYEMLGINGASANIILDWNEEVLASNLERRNPALIVLAYGTNEAGHKDWTVETYREMLVKLIERLRAAAPTAAILLIGPPDRDIRTRKGWVILDNVDTIVEAQREAALAEGCAFWDLRAKMGGKGSMRQWVLAGMGQYDHVHFTAPGYKMIGDAVFRDLMSQYDVFLKVRDSLAKAESGNENALGAAH